MPFNSIYHIKMEVGDMAPWLRVLTVLSENSDFVPSTHMKSYNFL